MCVNRKKQGKRIDNGYSFLMTVAEVADLLRTSRAAIYAYLHDTLEDTDVSPEQIGARFGATVLRAVRQLTRKEGSSSTGYFDDMDALALAVKLGDRIANLRVIGIAAYGSVERYGKLLSNYQDEMPGLLRKALPLAGSFQQAVDVLHRELVLAHQRLATASTAKRIPPFSETLPQYFIVGARPVKAVLPQDGGIDVSAYDWDNGTFGPGMQYLAQISFFEGDVERVTKEGFDRRVAALRS